MTIHLNQGHFAAILLALGLIFWMLSGELKDEEEFSNPRPLVIDSGLKRVQVERMQGQPIQREITVSAHTAANRRVNIKAEVSSTVEKILKPQGAFVKKDEIIIELETREGPVRMKQAKANLKQRQIEAASVKKLQAKGLANESQVALAETQLANAEAELIRAHLLVESSLIRAPFDGVIDQRSVEVGDFVREGSDLVTVMDFSPYLIKGQVAELEASNITIGDRAFAELVNGDRVEGKVRFIAAEADPKTRTYLIEVEIANPSGSMTSGLTAKLFIPQPVTHSYLVSPALLILSDDGKLGLKGIDDGHNVVFRPINLLKADVEGIWVYGLGESAEIITVGQGFVKYGEQVEPVYLTEDRQEEAQPESTPNNTALNAG